MATYWVDFNSNINGIGTSGNPFNSIGFLTQIQYSSDIFYCKGYLTLTSNQTSCAGITLTDWNISSYGPWRINGNNLYQMYVNNCKNGIIYNVKDFVNYGYCYDCFIYYNGQSANAPYLTTPTSGNTYVIQSHNANLFFTASSPGYTEKNSSFYFSGTPNPLISILGNSITYTDCQFSNGFPFNSNFDINNLAGIDGSGNSLTAIWGPTPSMYEHNVSAFSLAVNNSVYYTWPQSLVQSASFWTDVAQTSAGYGQIQSPWNWNQFYNNYSVDGGELGTGDNVYLRGQKDITNYPVGDKNSQIWQNQYFYFNMLPWNLSAYGPWAIYDSVNNISLNYVNMLQGGIIRVDTQRDPSMDNSYSQTAPPYRNPSLALYSTTIDNCFILAQRITLRSLQESIKVGLYYCQQAYCGTTHRNINIRGSTLISSGANGCDSSIDIDLREPTSLLFKDSLLYSTTQYFLSGDVTDLTTIPNSAISATYDWVVTSAANISQLSGTSSLGIINTSASSHIQYGWQVPTTWPNWNDSKTQYSYSKIGTGITISGSGQW